MSANQLHEEHPTLLTGALSLGADWVASVLLLSGVLPLIGGIAVLAVFIDGLTTQTHQVSIVAGAIVILCVVAAIIARFVSHAPYFKQPSAAHQVVTEYPEDMQVTGV